MLKWAGGQGGESWQELTLRGCSGTGWFILGGLGLLCGRGEGSKAPTEGVEQLCPCSFQHRLAFPAGPGCWHFWVPRVPDPQFSLCPLPPRGVNALPLTSTRDGGDLGTLSPLGWAGARVLLGGLARAPTI